MMQKSGSLLVILISVLCYPGCKQPPESNIAGPGLAGDARLPAEQRRTRTNVTRLPNAWAFPMSSIPNNEYGLIEGGLAGPVKIITFKID